MPLDLGQIVNGAFSTLGRHWKQLFGIGGAVYGGVLAVIAAATAIAYSATSDHLHRIVDLPSGASARSEDVAPLIIAFGSVWLVAMVLFITGTAMMQATAPAVLQDAVLGRRSTFGVIWRRAWARVPAVIGTVILTSLIAMVPMLLAIAAFVALMVSAVASDSGAVTAVVVSVGILGFLVLGPVAVWLWVKFSLAPSAVVFERQRPVAALRRSAQLVRGAWWRIFGISALAFVMAAVASYIIQLPFTFVGMFTSAVGASDLGSDPTPAAVVLAMGGYLTAVLIGQLIGQLISATFPPLVIGLLYVDRRIRNENLGAALAEAAAAPPQQGRWSPFSR
ncbi:hypothetical protein ACFVXE_03405 [Streptomyces sp. NPDC058231]|uniref:hypothetical protein n=1 Tax=Streptomyces sp. NPDC058231 TaxID=3346392 RepID=UPI0036EFAFDB